LAPAKYASLMMGFCFVSVGFGNKVAGMLGAFSEQVGEKAIFTGLVVFCVFFGLVLLLFKRKLTILSHGADDDRIEAMEDL